MSTTFGLFRGKQEVPTAKQYTPDYIEQDMYLNRFAGGRERGTSLQITIGSEYIQLDGKTADKLAEILSKWRELPDCDEDNPIISK